MLDIHVGVRRDEVKPFIRLMNKHFLGRNPIKADGDRWEDWGRSWPEDQTDEDDILHVVVTTDVPMATLNYLISAMQVFMEPVSNDDNPFVNRLLIVTDSATWDQYYHEFSYPE